MSGSVGVQPIDLYLNYAANETSRANEAVQSDPQASASLAYFRKVAPTITTPDALLKDYKALSVVLTSFGLQGSIQDTAIIRKLLTQDPTSSTSLAKKLGNVKYLLFANALSNWKTPPFATSAAIAKIASSYATNYFEQSADKQATGLANALSFTRQASSLKSIAAVQSDPNLLAVAVTSLGLPLQNFEQLDFDQQTAILKSKLVLSNFQSPKLVRQAAEQYLVSQQSTASTGPADGSVAALFSDGSDTTGDSVLSLAFPDASSSGSLDSAGTNTLSLFA